MFLDNEHTKTEEDGFVPVTEGSSSTSLSSSATVGIKQSGAVSPNDTCHDELFQREEQDVSNISRVLTPSPSGSASSEPVNASHERPMPLAEPPLVIIENKSSADDHLEETDDEDGSGEELVEIDMDGKGSSYLDRLKRLIES